MARGRETRTLAGICAHGWLQLLVRGDGQLTHSAVLEGDEYGQSEDFGDALPNWAASLLARLMGLGH